MASEEDSLEIRLNKATDPSLKEVDVEKVQAFCEKVCIELEGPLISTRLIAHKIQSPQEREALYALTTLEACVQSCGRYFHQEIGKFRFLNEIIKVVSPKYLGSRTTDKVKKKCVEILYSWTKGLPHEPKILDAYKMLKSQHIIKDDPVHLDKQTFDPFPPPKPRKADFEDDEKAKTLEKLLRSKHPEDLQAANRLIKTMVKEDAEKMEKRSRRINEIESFNNQVKLLTEMINHYGSSTSSQADKDMMKELFENLEKQRPNLFRLASDVEDTDSNAIEQILKVNDSVTRVMTSYKQTVEGEAPAGDYSQHSQKDSSLLDLDIDGMTRKNATTSANTSQPSGLLENDFKSLGLGNVDDFNSIFSNAAAAQNQPMNQSSGILNGTGTQFGQAGHVGFMGPQINAQQTSNTFSGMPPSYSGISHNLRPAAATSAAATNNSDVNSLFNTVKPGDSGGGSSSLADLDILDKSLQDYKLSKESFPVKATPNNKLPLYQIAANKAASEASAASGTVSSPLPSSASSLQATQVYTAMSMGVGTPDTSLLMDSIIPTATASASSPLSPSSQPQQPPPPSSSMSPDFSAMVSASPAPELLPLTDVFVPLDKIQPDANIPPVTAYDKNSLKMMIHFVQHRPRPDVITMVVSTISTNSKPITSFVFQSAVPKIMKVKLQPPSASDFPAFNPILPPAAITQVMLVANPRKEKVRLKYKIMYTLDGQNVADVGDVDGIPVL